MEEFQNQVMYMLFSSLSDSDDKVKEGANDGREVTGVNANTTPVVAPITRTTTVATAFQPMPQQSRHTSLITDASMTTDGQFHPYEI